MNVINFKDKTEFYWPECKHTIKSNDDVDCPYCRIAELEAKNEQLYQDRYDALSVTSKDGLLSSEWILRTGQAERKAKELEAKVRRLCEAADFKVEHWLGDE